MDDTAGGQRKRLTESNYCGQVLRYVVANGRAERDAAADLRGALPPVQE